MQKLPTLTGLFLLEAAETPLGLRTAEYLDLEYESHLPQKQKEEFLDCMMEKFLLQVTSLPLAALIANYKLLLGIEMHA